MTVEEKPTPVAGKAASVLLALLPPARMAWIVFTYGENNLSNDYLLRLRLVGSMLDGTCSLGTFLREAWIGGAHSGLAIFPIYYLNARFFHWSVWVELGLGLALVAAALALLACSIPGRARWLLLPLLSLLLFSTSRVTVFTFGECALQYGLSHVGVAIGVFALARWRERPIALATAFAFGGILASWSWGGGVMTWPVFAVALFALRVRAWRAWAILLGGSVLGVAQYVWFLVLHAPNQGNTSLARVLRVRPVLDLVGRPFLNGIGNDFALRTTGEIVGLAGLVALALVLLAGGKRGWSARGPALALIGWSLLVALQIVTFRPEGPPPWYVYPMAFFWIGLALLVSYAGAPSRALGLAAIALLSLRVQRTWEDKSFYLPSRAPVSAACLREWKTAPPFCNERIIQWAAANLTRGDLVWLGLNLEKWGVSVFGPRRTYLLQGDVPLGRVRLDPASAPSFFSRDGKVRGHIEDFHRLDLVLSPGAAATWQVDLPLNLKSARFLTRVHAGTGDKMLARGARVSIMGDIVEARVFVPAGSREALVLDLRAYAGRTVTLRVLSEEAAGDVPLLFEAPRVELEITRNLAKGAS